MKENSLKQSTFWDIMNSIELPIVMLAQRAFFAKELWRFHLFIQDILSTKYITAIPLIVYGFGYYATAANLARGLLLYTFTSSFGKNFFPRLRPLNYPQVYCKEPFRSSSFPSRHSIAVAVVCSPIPNPKLRIASILVMMLNRVITACHFPTDTIVGTAIGLACSWLAQRIPSLLAVLLACLSLSKWTLAGRIIGGSVPTLLLPAFRCPPAAALVAALKFPAAKLMGLLGHQSVMRLLVLELLVSSALALCTYGAGRLLAV